jgi:hypothetical protein
MLAMGLVLWFGVGDLESWIDMPAPKRDCGISLWLIAAGGASYLAGGAGSGHPTAPFAVASPVKRRASGRRIFRENRSGFGYLIRL